MSVNWGREAASQKVNKSDGEGCAFKKKSHPCPNLKIVRFHTLSLKKKSGNVTRRHKTADEIYGCFQRSVNVSAAYIV